MSLIHPQEMTEENLAAKRANGGMSQGPVTPEGKANSAAANLRHGFYSKAPNGALAALGEDPQEYADLMNALENNLAEGLENELVQRIGRALWRMKRAERIQDGLALKRIKAAKEIREMTALPQRVRAHESLQRYEDLAEALARRSGPTPDEIHAFVEGFGDDPPEEMQEFFALLKSLNKLPDGPERKAARRNAREQLQQMTESYRNGCIEFAKRLDDMESPESLAAQIAPQDEKALLMQRMEDSSLRQLWRLTNVLFKVRNGALAHKKDVKNEDRTDYVHENKGDDDTMSGEEDGFLHENAATAP